MSRQRTERPKVSRRSLLYAATAAFGVAGTLAAVWPFVAQMKPDADKRAQGDVIGIDLADLRPGPPRVIRWHGRPILVARRTESMFAAMHEKAFVARLVDPDSAKHQQPDYAKNWHRSIDPAYAVLVGVCTRCGCAPQFLADDTLGMAGGYICPCCASHYDPAGRAYDGIAPYNLPVPPHIFDGRARILVGKNRPGETFSLDSVERI